MEVPAVGGGGGGIMSKRNGIVYKNLYTIRVYPLYFEMSAIKRCPEGFNVK